MLPKLAKSSKGSEIDASNNANNQPPLESTTEPPLRPKKAARPPQQTPLLTPEQDAIVKQASAYEEAGNKAFRENDFLSAIASFSPGIECCVHEKVSSDVSASTATPNAAANPSLTPITAVQTSSDTSIRAYISLKEKILFSLYCNRATVFLLSWQFRLAEADCQQALLMQRNFSQSESSWWFKPWFRRALACEALARECLFFTDIGCGRADGAAQAQRHYTAGLHDLEQSLNWLVRERASMSETSEDFAVLSNVIVQVNDVNERLRQLQTKLTVSLDEHKAPLSSQSDHCDTTAGAAAADITASFGTLDLKISSPNTHISARHEPPYAWTWPAPPSFEQRDVIMRLLQSNTSCRSGDAYFLINWDWWCSWCRYVQFFAATSSSSSSSSSSIGRAEAVLEKERPIKSNGLDASATRETAQAVDMESKADTIDKVSLQSLLLLPRGAVLPDDEHDTNVNIDDIDDEEVRNQSNSNSPSPGPIDNSSLQLLHPEDSSLLHTLYTDWYREHYAAATTEPPPPLPHGWPRLDTDDSTHSKPSTLPLKPGLVRGHHYEIVPQDVYFALRFWYGELSPSICRRAVAASTVASATMSATNEGVDGVFASDARHDDDCRVMLYLLEEQPSCRLKGSSEQCDEKCNACGASRAPTRCIRCRSVFYCDRVCQRNGWNAHKVECYKAVPREHSKSRAGLENMGNTCFLNAVLQCMFEATPLTRYLLSGKFKGAINESDPPGSAGRLVRSYEDVVKALNSDTVGSCRPELLMHSIDDHFTDGRQHDAQEFLVHLLYGLHRDLNRKSTAPRLLERPEPRDGQCLAVAGARAWDEHLRCNASLVLDLFDGLFKSTCTCPKCDRSSVSFEVFNHVSLEIPQHDESMVGIEVLLFRAAVSDATSGTAAPVPMRYLVKTSLSDRMGDFKESLSTVTGIPMNYLELCEYGNHEFRHVVSENATVAQYKASLLAAYEVPSIKHTEGPLVCHIILSHKLVDELRQSQVKSNSFGLPLMAAIPLSFTCREVWDHLWALVCRLAINADGFDSTTLLQLRVVTQKGKAKPIFTTVDSEPQDGGQLDSILPRDSDEPLATFVGEDRMKRCYLFVHFEWMKGVDEELFSIVSPHSSYTEAAKSEQERNAVTLDQCFESFTKPERLDEYNKSPCSSCNERVRLVKTMALWKLPNILIVHLKRFEFDKEQQQWKKRDTLVDFPLEGLDLHAHCAARKISTFVDDRVPAIYDCFAVVNHFGGMVGGHYTAYTRPWDEAGRSNEWTLFNDSEVTSVGDGIDGVVSAAAYIALYRRRTFA